MINKSIVMRVVDIAHFLKGVRQEQDFQKCTAHDGWTYRCLKGGDNCVTCLMCEAEAAIEQSGDVCGTCMFIEAPYKDIPELDYKKKVVFNTLINDLKKLLIDRDAKLKELLNVLVENDCGDLPLEEMTALDRQVGGDHYKKFKIQPVEFIHHNNLPYCLGNVVKYICRYMVTKNPQDLEKAKHYLDLQLELDNGLHSR